MNILISDNWLKEYLKTKATPRQIANSLSLSGPSVERVTRVNKDHIYDIEVTTNRVDCMGVIGMAREASAILPNSNFKNLKFVKTKQKKEIDLLHIKIDPKFVKRVMAVVMKIDDNLKTPKIIKERLENCGMRSLNPVVDITNYVMHETGHPTHVFDYDLLADKQLVFRLSDKGEKIITFDGKEYALPGGDVVIDDGEGIIIDLPGIIGTKNSVVSKNTKRIVFFIDNIDPIKIRKTSTRLGIRTNAAILNEKGVDPELATYSFQKGIELYKKICKAKIISKIYDIYPKPCEEKTIRVEHEFIARIIGVEIPSKKIVEILDRLGFKAILKNKNYLVKIPSWRADDVNIPTDIVEEIARIYGYQNLPSELMAGMLPQPTMSTEFNFENKVKNILKGYGGVEIYTNSLVPKEYVTSLALRLKNPLGEDSKYLRTSLKPSLMAAAKENNGDIEPFYLFEIANVYYPASVKANLPKEVMVLGIIFSNYSYRISKGIVESLMDELNAKLDFKIESLNDSRYTYFEISIHDLQKEYKEFARYRPISKYPSQIEDVTLTFPPSTKLGEVIKRIYNLQLPILKLELITVFGDAYTFRVWYHSDEKTLTDEDVTGIRKKYLKEIKDRFGGTVKD